MENAYHSLKIGGYLYIEARSIHDKLYGMGDKVGNNAFIYNNHYRRFLEIDSLKEQVKKFGFEVIEAVENTGFAPFGDDDPQIIRLIARK